MQDPFISTIDVPVPGGSLSVARSGPAPGDADGVVLAIHGLTASRMVFRRVARELSRTSGVCLLAPDLRGRGSSASLPGPYGLDVHVADLLQVLDFTGVDRAVLTGHSMGAFLAAVMATHHPERAGAVVLLDGGLPIPFPEEQTPEEVLEQVVEQSVARLRMTFASCDEYVDLWRDHPSLLDEWNEDVDVYARYEVAGGPRGVRCIISEDAVVADCTDLVLDPAVGTAAERVEAPLRVVRAPRGLFDDADPLLPREVVDGFLSTHPETPVEVVDDANHYTLLLGTGTGPGRVANLLAAAAHQAVTA